MIRENQVIGLKEASKHNLVAGILINFRNENNDTFFMLIEEYLELVNEIHKKSFNISDLEKAGITRIQSERKRTRYRYNINKMVEELHL